MSDIRKIGRIPLSTDENGYLGRECPEAACKKYFKVVLGTGVKDAQYHYCPYCGHKAERDKFWTVDQINHINPSAKNLINDFLKK